jgi:hypothetical protein
MPVEDDPVEVERLPLVPVRRRMEPDGAREVLVARAEAHLHPRPVAVRHRTQLVVDPERGVRVGPVRRGDRREEAEREIRVVAEPSEDVEQAVTLDDRGHLAARGQHVGDACSDPVGELGRVHRRALT